MKPLNNHGWGFGTFIIFLSLLFLAILLAAYLANKFERQFPRDNYRDEYIKPIVRIIK